MYRIGNFGISPTDGQGNGMISVEAKALTPGNGDHQRTIYLKSTDGTRTATIILRQKDPAQNIKIQFILTYEIDASGNLTGDLVAQYISGNPVNTNLPQQTTVYVCVVAQFVNNPNGFGIESSQPYVIPVSFRSQHIELQGFVNNDHLNNEDYEIALSFNGVIGNDVVDVASGYGYEYSCAAQIDTE